jgi:hypothetical protein
MTIFFLLQATILVLEPSLMELLVEIHVWSDDRQNRVQQFIDSRAQHFIVCSFSIIVFLSYYLMEFYEFLFFPGHI